MATDCAYSKCSVISFGSHGYEPTSPYSLSGIPLQFVSSIRDLGVCLNSDLTPSMHCSNIAAMAFNRSCHLLKCFHSNDVSLLVRLYVRSLLESNTQVWNPWFHKDIQCIERVQRFFTRAILKRAGVPYMDYDDHLANLGLQSLEYRRTLSCATRSIITWLIYLLRVFSPNRLGLIPSEVILVSCDPNIYPIMHSERIFSLNV